MAKPKLRDLLKGTTGSPVAVEAAAVSSPVVPGSSPPAAQLPTDKATAGGAPIRQRRPPTDAEVRAQARRLAVRTFVRAFLTPGDSFNNAGAAYRKIHPEASDSAAWQGGWRMFEHEDVKEEMQRQLRAIDKAADLDDQWVYDRWRAIANANIFDYVRISADGVVEFIELDPAKLTLEQQLCIQEIQIDVRTGRIKAIKLPDKNQAVANVAKARQMIDGKRDLGAVDLAARITERMNKAAARVGRVFDHDSGEQV